MLIYYKQKIIKRKQIQLLTACLHFTSFKLQIFLIFIILDIILHFLIFP